MESLIAFFIIELLQFFFFLSKKRRNAFVITNTMFQVILSIGAIRYVELGFYDYEVVFMPLLFFAFLNFITNWAIAGPFAINSKIIKPSKLLYSFSAIYIVFSIYFLFWKWGDALALANSGDYMEAYQDANSDDVSFHGNFFEQIVVNYLSYFYIPIMLYGFCCLAFKRNRWGVSIILSVFVSRYMWATVYSSRTILVSLLVLLFLCTITFYKHLSESTQKVLKYGGSGLTFLIILVLVLISSSRFDGMELADWIYTYFGRTIITFQDVVCSIRRYSDGAIFFSYIVDFIPISNVEPKLSRDLGQHFMPEFARLYEDFGIWFIPFLLLPIIFVVKRIFSKKMHCFADCYLILSYFFVIFTGNLYKTLDFMALLMTAIIFFILRYSDVKIYSTRKYIIETSI